MQSLQVLRRGENCCHGDRLGAQGIGSTSEHPIQGALAAAFSEWKALLQCKLEAEAKRWQTMHEGARTKVCELLFRKTGPQNLLKDSFAAWDKIT